MAQKQQAVKGLFWVSILSFFFSSASVLIIPLASRGENGISKLYIYIIGAMFWLGLIVGFVLLFIINKRRKSNIYKLTHKRPQNKIPFVGLCANKLAMIFDGILALSIIGIIFVVIYKNQIASTLIIFLLLFSIEMHGMFNGENYKYINSKMNFGGHTNE